MSILSSTGSGQVRVAQEYMKKNYAGEPAIKWEVRTEGPKTIVEMWVDIFTSRDTKIVVEGNFPCSIRFRGHPSITLVNFTSEEQFNKLPDLKKETKDYVFTACDFGPSQIWFVRDNYEHIEKCGIYLPEEYKTMCVNTIETIGYKEEDKKVDLRALVSLLLEKDNQCFSLEWDESNEPYIYKAERFPPINKVWKYIAKDQTDSVKWVSLLQSLWKHTDKNGSIFYSNGEIYYSDYKYQNNWPHWSL